MDIPLDTFTGNISGSSPVVRLTDSRLGLLAEAPTWSAALGSGSCFPRLQLLGFQCGPKPTFSLSPSFTIRCRRRCHLSSTALRSP
ncbi:hypothetical protein ACLOJK_013548 [Asimina triloba]